MAVRRIDSECSSAVHVRQGVETKHKFLVKLWFWFDSHIHACMHCYKRRFIHPTADRVLPRSAPVWANNRHDPPMGGWVGKNRQVPPGPLVGGWVGA